MGRITTILSLSTAVALAACTSKTDNGVDTTAAMGDTAMTTATATSTVPAGNTAVSGGTGSTAASSTVAIVPININTATDAQILAIPGVGPRMLREFKEYRPYTSIEQFRREIGKYVDKAEVARLEQYITIQ
jgi:DNA uptake protein ComE-like DNA-binding protein